MISSIIAKLPMRDKAATRDFYCHKLRFQDIGSADFDGYLLLERDGAELHFFAFAELNLAENYGQIYVRTPNIEALYAEFLANGVAIHPNGQLAAKPWGQKEFSVLDPDHNLLTFGQGE